MPSDETLGSCPTDQLRNICILAHVDHGKTTCADNLICANGIISRHSAGKIRYLDSRTDEQERQITMKSSSIALQYAPPGKPTYMVNLIDSPGHVDFTSEVSTAARLADGALIVVDVVEGVEAQTRTVLRQAWRDRVKTVLFLNKFDRLIVELELTPLEAYERLIRIVEQINAVNQQLLSEDLMAKDSTAAANVSTDNQGDSIDLTGMLDFDEATEEAWRYSPERGNVAFGSATHGWAFRIDTFAQLIANKMGAKAAALQRVLWGEWAFSTKAKRAVRRPPGDTKTKPMFVQFILDQIWSAYGAAYTALDLDRLSKMQAQIPSWKPVELSRLTAGASATRDLMSRWLPFADCILDMAVDHLPSPSAAASSRLPVICPRWFAMCGGSQEEGAAEIIDGLKGSDRKAPAVAYLARFLAADLERSVLTGDALVGDEDVQFVGICRVFSGTLRPGQDLFVMSAAEGDATAKNSRVLRAERLFVLKGRFLEETSEAPAGCIIAAKMAQVSEAGNSELGVERFLTLCSVPDGPCFETPYSTQAFAIVRVNIEPKSVTDAEALYRGLRLLHRADPSVSVEVRTTGENVLGCCGDEHLKRCITDLTNMYARNVPLSISPPLVAVRESLAAAIDAERIDPKAPMWLPSWSSHLAGDATTEASSHVSNDHDDASDSGVFRHQPEDRISMSAAGVVSSWTANRKACLRVSAVALPNEVLEWMDANAEEIEALVHRQRTSPAFAGGQESTSLTLTGCLEELRRQFEQKVRDASSEDGSCPGLELLGVLCGVSVTKGSRTVVLDASGSGWQLSDSSQTLVAEAAEATDSAEAVPRWMRPSVLAGFQLASSAGPLCEEPMRGVAFVMHGCHLPRAAVTPALAVPASSPGGYVASSVEDAAGALPKPPTEAALAAVADPYGPMSGQVMVATKEACRCCLFRRGFSRICEAMLSLEVQSEQEMLGKVYAVLGKRRVKVLEEGLREGTSLFYISSHLPLADSFGLAQDLRQAASGQVSFHCAFSHWEQSEEDPFQEASLTAQEIEDLGDQPLPPNIARKLIDAIRKRKGLATDEKVVKDATKQRTVTRNK